MELLAELLGLRVSQVEVITLGVLVAVTCALVGVFLVLRRMAMMGDAISHTVFSGEPPRAQAAPPPLGARKPGADRGCAGTGGADRRPARRQRPG
jgi:hypothetical protein